jgi:single-stranded DNA-binding protein
MSMFRPTLSRAFAATQRTPLARMSLIGRLGADPELVNTSTGRELVRYVVASDSGPADNRTTNWFRVAAFPEGKVKDYLLGLSKG